MGYDPDKHKVQFIIEKSLSCDILEKLCLTTEISNKKGLLTDEFFETNVTNMYENV